MFRALRNLARSGQLPLSTAMLIDAAGNGLFAPLALLFANAVVGLSLTTAGLVLTIAFGAATALQPIAGLAIDRFGARNVAIAANGMLFAGSIGMLLAHDTVVFAVSAFVYSIGGRAFWAGFTPLAAGIAPGDQLERWFGRIRGIRYAGFALGGALAAPLLAAGYVSGLRVILALNAASFLIAGLLYVRLKPDTMQESDPPTPGQKGGYRRALADSPNVVLACLNLIGNLVVIIPLLAMPIFVLYQLKAGAWVPGLLVAVSGTVISFGSVLNARFTRGRRRVRSLQLSGALWTIGFALFLVADFSRTAVVATLVVAMIVLGIGEAIFIPTADAIPAALAPPGLTGRYSALHQMAWAISDMLAPYVSAILLSRSSDALWIVLGAGALLSIVVYRTVERVLDGRDGISGAGVEAAAAT